MSLIPREYAYLAAILALAGSLWWFGFHERTIGAQKCLTNQQVQAARDKAQGEQAVAEARALAAEHEAQKAKEQATQNKIESEKIKNDAAKAHAKASALELRYQLQLKTDQSCQKWSAEKIPCPLE